MVRRSGPLLCLLALLAFGGPAAARDYVEAVVAEPFLELHTGPGRGYPVFHVVDRGQAVQLIRRRTDWYQVETAQGLRGWARGEAIARTLVGGEPFDSDDAGADGYSGRRWEAGLLLGDFDGASSLTLYGARHFGSNFSAELRLVDISGDFSDGWLLTANLVHQPFPQWRLSPYATLGTGIIRIEPHATLVQTPDRTDQVGQVGLGLRTHLTRRFIFRAEYSHYLVFTSRDENEDIEEWKAGFAFFF